MTEPLIEVKHLNKRYGRDHVLKDFSTTIERGEIIGLLGPNGASKTTFMRALLGLVSANGEINLFGKPLSQHSVALFNEISFIADTAILPRWMKVSDCLNYVEAVHPKFNRELVNRYLANTNIAPHKRISQLSKGMVTQLHLALVMAIDSSLMVLDEPTLGLDIVYRKTFYKDLLEQYFDQNKTIIITTHQIEEIEDIVTRLIFINNGHKLLDTKVENIEESFCEVRVDNGKESAAQALSPIHTTKGLEGLTAWYENADRNQLAELGTLLRPRASDLFVAKVMQDRQGGNAHA